MIAAGFALRGQAMRTVPCGRIKLRYERDGYVVVPNIFSKQECHALLKEVDRIAALAPGTANVFPLNALSTFQRAGVSKTQAGDQYFIIGELPTHGKLMASFVGDKRIAAIASAVLGGRGRSAPVRYHFSNVTNKPPRIGPKIRWHRDFPNNFITLDRAQFCRVMVCLDGMTRFNGPTAFEPSTHRISDAQARRTKRRKQRRNPRRERLAVCPPGSVVVFHAKVRHGGGVNRSPQPRRNVIVQWGMSYAKLVFTSLEQWSKATPDELRHADTDCRDSA